MTGRLHGAHRSRPGFSVDHATVRVIWDFHGYKSLLDLPGVNDAKAGADLTLKFSLSGDQGLDIFRAGHPASASFPCGTTPLSVTTEGAVGRLRYDARKDEYAYVWATQKAWKDTCRIFALGLADGTTHDIAVHFK